MRTAIPRIKITRALGLLQVIDFIFADPEIAVMRAAALHRSPPTAASTGMLSGTYYTLGPLTLWEA